MAVARLALTSHANILVPQLRPVGEEVAHHLDTLSIIQNHQDKYPGIRADVKYLDFTDEYLFCKSYLIMLKNINYPE